MKFSLLALASGTSALVTLGEKCPDTPIPVMTGFDKAKYTGLWFVQKSDFRGVEGECTAAKYTEQPNGDITVFNRTWLWFYFFSYFSNSGFVGCPTTTGACAVQFGNTPPSPSRSPNYHILETDYTNYTIIYNCSNKWYGKQEVAWIMAREYTVSDAALETYEQRLKDLMPSFGHSGMVKSR